MRLLFAVVVLTGITSAGVLVLMPKGIMPVPVAQDGDVRDFGFGRASPVLAAPRVAPTEAIPAHLRLQRADGRCLDGGVLSTALVAGGWCGEQRGEELPADGERIHRLPRVSPVHPVSTLATRGIVTPDGLRPPPA